MYELPNFIGSTEHPQDPGLAGGSGGKRLKGEAC